MKPTPILRLSALTALMLLSLSGAQAQSTGKDSLSDAERAKRDAEKVFSFIKFSTVKPAAAAAPAVAPTAAPAAKTGAAQAAALAAQAAPAAVRTAASPATQAAALAAVQASTAAAAQQQPPTASAPAAAPAQTEAALTPAATPATASVATPANAAPAAAAGLAAATAASPAPAVVPEPEPEEVPLKLVAYTAPELNAKVLNALGDRRMVVPVRFKVEANGTVSAAQALGNAPRVLELSAVRAVQQWKFDKLPAAREVDVEIAFKAGD